MGHTPEPSAGASYTLPAVGRPPTPPPLPKVAVNFAEILGRAALALGLLAVGAGLDLDKYQRQKVRHYRNRCREMGITPDQSLVDQILDPSIDFVVGVEAG